MIFTIFLSPLLNIVLSSDIPQVSLDEDPGLFPGHMEPLGAKQPHTEIEELMDYPSPKDFFENYIKPGQPFLLKKGAMDQRAYKLWTDEYMSSFPEAAEELVKVEPNKKENRDAQGFEIPLKEFISRYHNESIYMVNKVPTFLQKDILMPSPLRCNNTRELMLDHITWMSSGGTKSVLHNDDLDNINCLFRGEKELLFISPKYRSKIPIDKPRGGYSTLDVDIVDFNQYPTMREIEYIHCKMEEGDCLFIPYGWFHQVNSIANENHQNIAVNIWFNHDPGHVPDNCDVPDDKTSIDNWSYITLNKQYQNIPRDDENERWPLINLIHYLISKTNLERANLKTLLALIRKVDGIFTETSITHLVPSIEFVRLGKELFRTINVNEDKYIDEKDFELIRSNNAAADELEEIMNQIFDEFEKLLRKELQENPQPSSKEVERSTENLANLATNAETNPKSEL